MKPSIAAKLGRNCGVLTQLYAVHKATAALRARGLMVQRQAGKNGAIKLIVQGAGL